MQLELPKRLNSILPILKWNLTFYFRRKIIINATIDTIYDTMYNLIAYRLEYANV